MTNLCAPPDQKPRAPVYARNNSTMFSRGLGLAAVVLVGAVLLAGCGGDSSSALDSTTPRATTTSTKPRQAVPPPTSSHGFKPVDCLERKGGKVSESGIGDPTLRLFSVRFGPEYRNSRIEIEIYGSAAEAHEELPPPCFRPGAPERCLDNTLARHRWGHVIVDWDKPPETTLSVVTTCFGGPADENW